METKKGMVQTVLVAAVGIVGGLVGSSYQQYLSSKLEYLKSFDSWRREAYVSYLSGMEKLRLSEEKKEVLRSLKQDGPEKRLLKAKADQLRDEWEYEAGTSAKKIAVFGNTEVAKTIAVHWRQNFRSVPCGSDWKEDLAIFRAMREQSVPNEPKLSDADLAQVTIRCTPPKQ